MPTLQNFLNAWVKVNNKHIVYGPSDRRSSHAADHYEGDKLSRVEESTKEKTGAEDQELQAIRRFNSRKHRRRLHRTNSATDLIREKAKKREDSASCDTGNSDKASQQSGTATSATAVPTDGDSLCTGSGSLAHNIPHKSISISTHTQSSNTATTSVRLKSSAQRQRSTSYNEQASSQESRSTVQHANYINDDGNQTVVSHISKDSESSLKWVAGFFGADVASTVTEAISQNSEYPRTCASELSVQQSQTSAVTAQNSTNSGLRFLPNPFFNGRSNCPGCKALEVQMMKAQQDIEYLRAVSIRNEYVCSSCNCSSSKARPNTSESPNTATLSQTSERLQQLRLNYQMQVEKITKEQSQSQHDMNVKLMELSSLCKNLDEDCAASRVQCVSLQNELDETRSQRDEMAGEIQQMRAKLAAYEKMSNEHRQLKAIMHDYERKGLERASKAIETRDKLISDLSLRLELSLDTLELERQQQRQRRLIMFPARQGENSAEDSSSIVFDELKKTKEELRKNQSMLESTKAQTKKTEMALLARCENLEKQLESLKNAGNVTEF